MSAPKVARVRAVVHPKIGECYAVSLHEIAQHVKAGDIIGRIKLSTAASKRDMDDDENSINYGTLFLGVNVLTLAAMLSVYGFEVKIDQSLCPDMPSPKGTAPKRPLNYDDRASPEWRARDAGVGERKPTWAQQRASAPDPHHDQRESSTWRDRVRENLRGTTTHQRPQPPTPLATFFSRKVVADVDYHTLGVLPSAPFAVIRAAYRALALEHHPDRGGNEETLRRINVAFGRIEKARGGA